MMEHIQPPDHHPAIQMPESVISCETQTQATFCMCFCGICKAPTAMCYSLIFCHWHKIAAEMIHRYAKKVNYLSCCWLITPNFYDVMSQNQTLCSIFSGLDLDRIQTAKEGCGQQLSEAFCTSVQVRMKMEIILAFKIFLCFNESLQFWTKICVQP